MSSLTSSPYLPLPPVAAGVARKSGRAVCSDRGDAVWEWQVATGVFERDVTDEQLRRLEAPDLQIVEFTPTDTGQQAVWNRDTVQRPASVGSRRSPARAAGPLAQLWALLRGVS
ncbi:MAG TPA: hypothetical protein PKE27_10710 [Povalibacter sp.]|uniref:hypothetical protein n=1 Tax=Povalibacter sp. TaxID=1962978 RepID=UPI002BA5630D|nr:hypothetical protein [Povalibacter sp.]HMN45037.1 hypothetical protein [Povalibacter sp.]